MAVGGLIVCVLTSIHGGLLCRHVTFTERHVYCSSRRDYSFGKSVELWPMVALLLSTLLGRPGIYTPWKERANGNKMAPVGGCDSRIVSRRYAIFIVNGPANEQGKGGIRVLYVRRI